MASTITLDYGSTGKTLYALILNDAGSIWNGSSFVTIVAANWATYAVAMTEISTSGIYEVAFPALAAGVYGVSIRERIGGSPAITDTLAGNASVQWSGSQTIYISVDAILDEVVEGSLTFRQMLRLFMAVLANKSSGGGTSTIIFRDLGDTKARITATIGGAGNRNAVIIDGS